MTDGRLRARHAAIDVPRGLGRAGARSNLGADRAMLNEQILADLCKWMDVNGSLATLRHGFKCYGARSSSPTSRPRTS
jgi:hypothetical protein